MMRQFTTIFKREMMEISRNFKWIWVPIVFILLGIMDPLSTYYLPQILEAVGGLPDGATIDIPTPSSPEILMMSIGQFSQLGVLTIVLMSMGLIAGERKSGVAELVLVKPVSHGIYILAKWAGTLVLALGSLTIGMAAAWYYTNLLFDPIPFTDFLWALFFYGMWIVLVVSITVFMNTLFKTPGLVGFLSVLTIIVLNIVSNIFGHALDYSPTKLSPYIQTMLVDGSVSSDLWGTAAVTIVCVVILLLAATFVFRTKELA
ncbi:ABC transporter permease [Thalassobacillus hwangdonensis]|uniref:ABC transporter permease n=1 Tax=Thalassobacillus hwangdonensis TaxID=546108 RepID=A0ABW3L3Q5_9BACI